MPYALVGTIGAVSQGAASAAVTPAWGTSENRTAGNLLVCWVTGSAVATFPTTPAGWTIAVQRAGTSCSVTIYIKQAAGADAAPTIAAVTSAIWSVQLGEFSGGSKATNPVDNSGVASGTTSPLTATASFNDSGVGDLVLVCDTVYVSSARTNAAWSPAVNNGVTLTSTNNSGTSTQSHYGFSYGLTTSVGTPDSHTFTYTTTQVTGAAAAMVSIILSPVGAVSMSGTAGLNTWVQQTWPGAVSMSAGTALQAGPPVIALVSAGTVTTWSSTQPSFGQATTAGNLLVLMVANPGGGNPPVLSSNPNGGWLPAVQSSAAVVWFRSNCKAGETAPTLSGGSTSGLAQLLEFSGTAKTGIIVEQFASTAATTTSPVTATAPQAAANNGNLLIGCVVNSETGALTSHTLSFNNATAANTGSSTGLPAYLFAWGAATSNAAADSATYSWTGGTGPSAVVTIVSFMGQAAQLPGPTFVSAGPEIHMTSPNVAVTPAFGQPTTAGNLLVCLVSNTPSGAMSITTNPGGAWVQAVAGTNAVDSIWYRPNCLANETAPSFTPGNQTGCLWQLLEFAGVATTTPLDVTAIAGPVASTPLTVTGATADAGTGELLVLAGGNQSIGMTTPQSLSFNNATAVITDNTRATPTGLYGFGITTANASPDSATYGWTSGTGSSSAAIASFKPAVTGPPVDVGAITMSGTAGLTATPAVQEVASVSESATAGLTAVNGLVTEIATVAESATAGLTVAATTQPGTGGAPHVVQTASASGASNATSLTVNLGSTPTVGNQLLAIVSVTEAVPTFNASWKLVQQGSGDVPLNHPMNLMFGIRAVQGGDGTSWTFPLPGTGNTGIAAFAVVYEIAGALASQPLFPQVSMSQNSGTFGMSGFAGIGASNTLAIGAIIGFTNTATPIGALDAASTPSTGWTVDNNLTVAGLYGSLATASVAPSGTTGANLAMDYGSAGGNTGITGVVIFQGTPNSTPYVQVASISGYSEQSSLSLAMPQVPKQGNTLVAFAATGVVPSGIVTPSGWTQLAANGSAGGNQYWMTSCWQTVPASPAQSYTFALPANGDASTLSGLVIYEIAGTAGLVSSASQPQSTVANTLSSGSLTTPALSPTAASTLALGAFNNFTPANPGLTPSSWPTIDPSSTPAAWQYCTRTFSVYYGVLTTCLATVNPSTVTQFVADYTWVNGSNPQAVNHLVLVSIPALVVSLSGTSSLNVGGTATEIATVAESATAGMTATSAVTEVASVSQAATASMTVGATVQRIASVTLAGGAVLNTSGATTQLGIAALSATAGLTATPAVTEVASVAQSASAGMTPGGAVTEIASVSQAATSSMNMAASVQQLAGVTLAGGAVLNVAGLTVEQGSVALSGSAVLTVTGLRTVPGAVTLAGTTVFTAGAAVTEIASVALSGSTNLTVTGLRTVLGGVTLSGTAGLTVTGIGLMTGTVSQAATSNLTITALAQEVAAVSLAGTAGLQATSGGVNATLNWTATASLTVAGLVTQVAAVSFTTTTSLTATGLRTAWGIVAFSSTTNVTVGATAIMTASVSLTSSTSLILSVTGAVSGSVVLVATAGMTVVAYVSQIITGLFTAAAVSGLLVDATVTTPPPTVEPPTPIAPPHPPAPKKSKYAVTMNPGDPFGGWTAVDETLYKEERPEVSGVTSGYNPR